jgi:hypothetical protein
LLVEIGAQPFEFFGVAEVLRRDDLVVFLGEGLVVRAAGFGPRG